MNKALCVVTVLAGLLSGCGGTASCNDGDVKETVAQIIDEQVKTAVWGRELFENGRIEGFDITDVKTTDRNETLDTYTCEATVEFEFDGKPQSKPIQYELAYLEDNGDTDVTVYGADDVKIRLMALAMTGGR